MKNHDDRVYIDNVKQGNLASYTYLVEKYKNMAFTIAMKILSNAQDAEDAAQETFLKLYRNGAWRAMEDERAFLARATWRVALDRLKASRPLRLESLDEEDTGQEPASEGLSPEQQAVAGDWMTAVHRMIDALPEELRQVLALASVEELNSREMAEVLGVPEGTVRTRLMRARQMLKQKMEAAMGRRKEGRYAR